MFVYEKINLENLRKKNTKERLELEKQEKQKVFQKIKTISIRKRHRQRTHLHRSQKDVISISQSIKEDDREKEDDLKYFE